MSPQSTTPDPIVHFPTRRSRIARLPKSVRDRINSLLADGFPYKEIIRLLAQDAPDLNEDVLTRWKSGGYQDWLRFQAWFERTSLKTEYALDLHSSSQNDAVDHAAIGLASANVCQILAQLDPAPIRETLSEDPDKYTRLLNAISRVSHVSLRFRHHLQKSCAQARAQAPAQPGSPPHQAPMHSQASSPIPQSPGISQESLSLAEQKLNLL